MPAMSIKKVLGGHILIENSSINEGICVYYKDNRAHLKISEFLKSLNFNKCIILCIGTDRFIGDCLGPLTGTLLSKLGLTIPVIGTLENPIHAINLRKTLSQIKTSYGDHRVIAIDACLGTNRGVGYIQVKEGSIQPGRGVGKKLSYVGDCSIMGIVDKTAESDDYEYENYLRMSNVRLGTVLKMAETIVKGVYAAYGSIY